MKEIASTWTSPANRSDLATGGLIADQNIGSWIPRNHRSYAYAGNIVLSKIFDFFTTPISDSNIQIADVIIYPSRGANFSDGDYCITFELREDSAVFASGNMVLTFTNIQTGATITPTAPSASSPLTVSAAAPVHVQFNLGTVPTRGIRCRVGYTWVSGGPQLRHLLIREKILVAGDL